MRIFNKIISILIAITFIMTLSQANDVIMINPVSNKENISGTTIKSYVNLLYEGKGIESSSITPRSSIQTYNTNVFSTTSQATDYMIKGNI